MRNLVRILFLAVTGLALMGARVAAAQSSAPTGTSTDGWAYYGHDAGGMRYSPLTQINRQNVAAKLKVAWVFHTEGHLRWQRPQETQWAGNDADPGGWNFVFDHGVQSRLCARPRNGQAKLWVLRSEDRCHWKLWRWVDQSRGGGMARFFASERESLPQANF